VLVLHGDADPFAPAEQVAGLEKELKDADVKYKLVLYPGAVHAFTNPAAGDDPSKGAAYNAEADKASMEEMRVFFSELFTEQKE
jgi:dienelactone hydrolase